MKRVWICLGAMVVFIIAAVFLKKAAKNTELDYEEVMARVVSSDSYQKRVRINGKTTTSTVYEIVVSYGGKEYDLKNAHNTYSYREGSTAKVYFSNGKMYADVEGVRSDTLAGKAHFVAVIGAFAMFILSMVFLTKVEKKSGGGPLQKVG